MVMMARVEESERLQRVFPGNTELASRMRGVDWATTKLGDPDQWPVTLRTALGICLASRFPMHIWWGPDLTLLYNDAFAKLLGSKKHPSALAQSGRLALAEAWEQLSPMVDRAFRDRIASGADDERMFFDRALPHEEVYVRLSFSPLVGETGVVEGMFCTWTETTEKLIAARRLETLRKLGALTHGRTVVSACDAVSTVLATNPDDIPFAVLYLMEGTVPRATTWVRLAPGEAGFPQLIDDARVANLTGPIELAVDVGPRQWPERVTQAVVVPIYENQLGAVLVCGVNPRRPLDPTYRQFFELVGSHIGASLANAHAFEQEQQRAQALAELARSKTLFFATITEELRATVTQLFEPIDGLLAKPHDPATHELLSLVQSGAKRLQGLVQAGELDIEAAADKLESIAISNARSEANDARAEARAKDDFLSLFGHELRNPLSTLLVTVDVLARLAPSIEMTLMERAVRHLARLVDDLLDLSRLHRGKIALHRTTVEIAQVIDMAVERAAPAIEEREIQVFVRVPRTGFGVDCDPDRIAQVVGKVLSNAAKYSPKGGRVTIEAKRVDTRVQLIVRDEGVGIAPERLAHVFDPFHDRQDHTGLGLGLAIARNLVELHGGELTVASGGKDQGTSVTIDLPFAPTRESQPVITAKKARKRVLLVEDNHDTAVALQRALETLGYQVALAHNGPVALTVARAFQPDVALLDINLPVMDGWELSRRLRELEIQSRELHFVAVTARDQEQDRQRSAEAGFADHLVKPIDLAALERVVENLPDPARSP